jgi:hypothetical protein
MFPDTPLTTDELIAAIAERTVAPVIVLDALDEATAPVQVMDELLFRLAQTSRPDGQSLCRLLVGMRPWPEFDLLQALASQTMRVDLDSVEPDRLRGELTQYVSRYLELSAAPASVTSAAGRATFARELAATLAATHAEAQHRSPAQRWGAFLVAALYTHAIATSSPVQLGDVRTAAVLGAAVPTRLPDVLELDLAERTASPWRRPVLAALAYGRGAGIPRSLLRLAADALSPNVGEPTELDVATVLEEMFFYLRTTTDTDATQLYRLFHQGLTDHLRNQPTPPNTPPPPDLASGLLDRLLAVTAVDGVRRWDVAEPYLLRHAIQHAADASRVDELITDPPFLVHADPTTLGVSLDPTSTEAAALAATVYRTSAGRHADVDPAARRQILAIDAARHQAHQLVRNLTDPPDQPPLTWRPVWATGSQISSALRATMIGHTAFVHAVACTYLGDRPIAVTTSADHTARVWDLSAYRQIGDPLTGHTDEVTAVACTHLNGRPVAVTTSRDSTVRIWDLHTNRQLGDPLTGHTKECFCSCLHAARWPPSRDHRRYR